MTPVVHLVGAGPGDPELLTLKAVKAIQAATVLLVDDLVNDEILAYARPGARIVHVGKRGGCRSTPQAFIERLMITAVQEGETVVRLKGGDPFIFGRGGEEIEALAARQIPFEVVPGVTAAAGAAAYAGIPLTHRDCADACVFVTGHLKGGKAQIDAEGLVRPRQTIVVYMGVGALAQICAKLVDHGLAPATPCALVERATLADQRVVESTLRDIASLAVAQAIRPPALLIVGEVVRLRSRLAWFSEKQVRVPSSAVPDA